jgi:predicted nucleic acid-binding Zn ribbon protein
MMMIMSNAEHCVCCGQVIPEGGQHCIICGEIPKKKRQIDRIRNMSVEELAEFMGENSGSCLPEICLNEDCKKCYKQWLEQEVEE